MINIYEELYLKEERNIDGTLEFELSKVIKDLIEQFLEEKYKTTLSKCCYYDEEYSRVVVNNEKYYFDRILGGTGNGTREKEFKQYLKKRGK